MEHFRLDHPPDRVILCDHPDCEEIADYLELHDEGREELLCATHTSSERHSSVLSSRATVAARKHAKTAPMPS